MERVTGPLMIQKKYTFSFVVQQLFKRMVAHVPDTRGGGEAETAESGMGGDEDRKELSI